MSDDFTGKVVLITGAGSGIGRATALKLASLGARIAACDISSSALATTFSDLSNPGEVFKELHRQYIFDVGSSQEVEQNVSLMLSDLGRIDYVFNCAGVNPTRFDLESTTDAYWDKLVNTNLRGVYNVTRACIPHLSAGAAFVNVSSEAGLRATAGYAIYCATKFGIIGFSKAMALELGPKGIRVNVVAPGSIETPTNAAVLEGKEAVKKWEDRVPLGRMGKPDEVADVVVFLFGNGSRYMSGSVVEVNGGI